MSGKVLTPITDKKGKQTRVWKNVGVSESNRSVAVGAPPVASTKPDIPQTIVAQDNQGEPYEIVTDKWTYQAEEVYMRGQCPSLAYNLAPWYPDAKIKVAMSMNGRTLIHVWLEDEGIMIDAQGAYAYREEDYVDELLYDWGTPEITEHTPESLREFVESNNPSARQSWEETARIIPAWIAEYDS